jgi:hypothetical protein
MASYRVTRSFSRFSRGYATGQVLTEADLSCWLPESARAAAIADLIARNQLFPVQSAPAPAAPSVLDQAEAALHTAEAAIEAAKARSSQE